MSARLRPRRLRAALAIAAATIPLAAAAAAAAAAPAPAAGVSTTYRAAFSGTFVYTHERGTEDGSNVSSESATFAVTLHADAVEFVDGLLLRPVVIDRVEVSDGRSSRSERGEDYRKDCSGVTVVSPTPASLLQTQAHLPSAPPNSVTLVPFVAASLSMGCIDEQGRPFVETIELGNLPSGRRPRGGGPFDLKYAIPRERMGDARITFGPYDRTVSNAADCPFRDVYTRTCTVAVRGAALVLDLVSSREEPDDGLLAPLGPITPRVTRGARRATTRATCPAGCRARIRVFLPGGRLGRSFAIPSAARPLASRSLTLKPSRRPQTIALPLGAAARAAARRAGALRLELTLDPPKGRTVSRAVVVPVPR